MVSQDEIVDAGLKAIADGTRREILLLLRHGQLSVLEIAERFPMSRPAISKHLRILKEAGLVLETPVGRQRLYTLEPGPLSSLRRWLARFGEGSSVGPPFRRSPGRGIAASRRPGQGADWRVW